MSTANWAASSVAILAKNIVCFHSRDKKEPYMVQIIGAKSVRAF
jgi:hypothetical protein